MQVSGAVALVTGANRGLGAAFAQALLDHGAAKVYAGARDISSIADPRLTPVQLDVTDPASVAAAAATAHDVTIVINNAGIAAFDPILGDDAVLRRILEVNFFGLISVSRAFAPILATNGGGALVNMLSTASFRQSLLGSYSVSKAAAWGATNATRVELAPQGTLVTGVHVGFLDTDMAAAVDLPKLNPRIVADKTMAGLEANAHEVFADKESAELKALLSQPVDAMYGDYLKAGADA
jgi:NAD(P)-dependent dehydrogenase (short-subunit alcohol dehydrogenase family)